MVIFASTARATPPVDLRTALFQGLAPDQGLYLPEPLAPLPPARLSALRGAGLGHIALTIAEHLLAGAADHATLSAVVREALDFPIPLVTIAPRVFALELFHGPTLAFKDVGARFMARLMARHLTDGAGASPLTVLVATSGDTGGAVAQAFHEIPGTRVVVLYPAGRISPIQERQFATLGGNVIAVAVQGTFDDCQRLTKEAFADVELRASLRLTSANSISIGRLLPQVFYYFHAWAQLPEEPAELIVSVPSGNFGNLTAGLIAKRLGLPVARFIAATNTNDVVPQYLQHGRFVPRAARETISTAMDVGHPSNFARMLALYGGDVVWMRRDVMGQSYSDGETRAAIGEVFRRYNYILDPHSAVGYLGLTDGLRTTPHAQGIFLATAHPAKFAEIVEPIIGQPVPLPERLAEALRRDPLARRIRATLPALERLLLGL